MNKYVLLFFLVLINQVCPCQSNNIAFFPFNGNAGDLSSNGLIGTVTGAVLTEDRCGHPNSAYYFDGVNDVITIPDNNVLDIGKQDYSIVAWIKTSSYNWGRIISKGSSSCQTGYMMRTGSSSASKIHLENAYQSSCKVYLAGTTTINDDQWHCVAGVVKRDSFAQIYIDGVFNTQQTIATSNFDLTNNNELLIGANYQNSIYPE
ncbi:MAG: LamG domain-containing protein [Saprospiraceae bacterium]|nr:LamG domain-containing protein [Saprospiraceae bacterium]